MTANNKRRVAFILVLALALPLVGCAGVGGTAEESDGIVFESVETPPPYSEQEFEMTDVLSYFAREDGADYAVSTDSFGVDQTVFEALFNLILYFEVTPGDGEYDEFEDYLDEGSLDLEKSVKSQTMPDSNVSWYADTRSRALFACFEDLHIFTYAKEHSISPISRFNELKIRKILGMVDDGVFGDDLTDFFGEGATTSVVHAAAALFAISRDPSALVVAEDLDSSPRPDYDVDRELSPAVAPAFEPAN